MIWICFTGRSKTSIFAPQGRFVAPIHVKFGTAEGHMGLLGCAKFHANRCTGVGTRPQNSKFSLFGKESLRRGEPFDRFLQVLKAFMRPTTYISFLHLTWFASQVTELLQRNRASVIYREFFRAPCRKKTMRWIEPWLASFNGLYIVSITVHSLEKIVLRAPAVGAKIWCSCVLFCFLSITLRSAGALFVRRGHSVNKYCVAVYGSILITFHPFLQK